MTWVVRHSKETEASPTLGGFTTIKLGSGVRPAWANSESPWASDSPVMAIAGGVRLVGYVDHELAHAAVLDESGRSAGCP